MFFVHTCRTRAARSAPCPRPWRCMQTQSKTYGRQVVLMTAVRAARELLPSLSHGLASLLRFRVTRAVQAPLALFVLASFLPTLQIQEQLSVLLSSLTGLPRDSSTQPYMLFPAWDGRRVGCFHAVGPTDGPFLPLCLNGILLRVPDSPAYVCPWGTFPSSPTTSTWSLSAPRRHRV